MFLTCPLSVCECRDGRTCNRWTHSIRKGGNRIRNCLLAHCPASIQTSCPKAPWWGAKPPCGPASGPADVQLRTSNARLSVSHYTFGESEGKGAEQKFEFSEVGFFALGRGSRASREGLQRPEPHHPPPKSEPDSAGSTAVVTFGAFVNGA